MLKFVYDEKGELGYTWFDANDLPPFTSYEVEGVENHHQFDLGDGYIVELIHLPGHTPGQSGYLDHQTEMSQVLLVAKHGMFIQNFVQSML